ncbi:MAG: MFS transporter [Spirochaetales bacterium]|nr:MFS transporter [Candidatus Physcosoma equi]
MSRFNEVYKENSFYKVFLTTLVLSGIGYGIYKGIIDNYMAEIVVMNEFDRGLLEFFRELPGLMLIFILAVLYTFSAERLYKIGAVIMLFGMGMLGLVSPTKSLVTIAVCTFSLGEHIQLGMKNTLSLQYAKEKKGGQALGYQNSIYQMGSLLGYLVIILAFSLLFRTKPYKSFFLCATVFLAAATFFAFRIGGESATDKTKSRFYFRKKFTKYYMLEVFYGARKQVFFTFGPYVLILHYGASASTLSLLFAISSICGFLLSPYIGRLIDRIGYKIVMVSDTIILVGVCFLYGFADHIFPKDIAFIVCCINYILDSIISLASMASNVYVKDISDSEEEVRATISTGISVNHLITIFIALFGGLIWQKLGIETLFIVSAILGLCNSAYAATIRTGKKA